MRNRFSQLITEQAQKDSRFYVLSGDHGYALFDPIRSACPDRFINAGICEQAMIGYAAGLAKVGFRPLVYGLASFIPMRVVEFIKMDICYGALPVILVGDGAGLVYSTLGSSHQCGEDIAVLRSLPGIRIYSPSDAREMEACFKDALSYNGPSYLRIGKCDRPSVHSHEIPVPLAPINKLHSSQGCRTALVATGSMVPTALTVGKEVGLDVFSAPLISSISATTFNEFFPNYTHLISIEEHCVAGGLGTILADVAHECPDTIIRVTKIGLMPKFTEIASSYEVALKEHSLDDASIAVRVRQIIGKNG